VSENESGREPESRPEVQAPESRAEVQAPEGLQSESRAEVQAPEAQELANEDKGPSVEPPGPAEITDPLPTIQVEPPPVPLQAAINQPTTALPLIDLLAPRQPGSPGGPAAAPGVGSPTHLPMGPVSQPGYPGGPIPAGPGATMIGRPAPPHEPPGAPSRRGWVLAAGAGGCVVLLGLIGWLAIGSLPTGERPVATTEAPPTSQVLVADGYQFTRHSAREDANCAGNAYGQVAEFFRDTPCSSLRRALFTSAVDDRPVVVSVSTVTMPDERSATALKRLADTNGTGNVTDLLRAGVRIPSLPETFSNPSYASSQTGGTVVIVESDYTEPAQSSDDALKRIGEVAIQLGHSG
jgi:hypothetical protein